MKKREKPESARIYEEALNQHVPHAFGAGAQGLWTPYPKTPPSQILAEIKDIQASGHIQTVASSPGSRLYRARMFGLDTLIREFDLRALKERWHTLVHTSRCRHLWAAAHTLRKLDIPTPKPLGFLDIRERGLPKTGYVFSEFVPGAVTVRDWLRRNYNAQPPELRSQLRRELLHSLMTLYRKQVYHGNAHCRNLLLRAPEDARVRAIYWVGADALTFGIEPTRPQIVENLVQLNASLGGGVPEADRLAFLRAMAREYPWLNGPKIMKEIRSLSRERLDRTQRRNRTR